LSLGNDGTNLDELEAARKAKRKKLLKAQKKAKQQAEAAAAAAAAANGEEDEGPCRRPDCMALRDSDDLEEKIFDERIEIEDKLKQKTEMLESIKQRVTEASMETQALSEKNMWLLLWGGGGEAAGWNETSLCRTFHIVWNRFKLIASNKLTPPTPPHLLLSLPLSQNQIKTRSTRVAELEEERDGLEDVIKSIMNNIMVLQVESQKARSLARQAQEALVNAMWRKDSDEGEASKRATLAGEPLMPLVIRKSKAKPPVSHWVKYTDLASGEAIDQSEILPGTSTGKLMESMALKAPETNSNSMSMSPLQGSFGGTMGGSLAADIWSSPGKQTTGMGGGSRTAGMKRTGKKTKSALNNRKIMLLMNTRKRGKKAGGGSGGPPEGLGHTGGGKRTGAAKSLTKKSVLADIKAETARIKEENLPMSKE
jgi:hypothetical protein